MRILVLNESDEGSLGSSYARAFRLLGHEVRLIDPVELLSRHGLWKMRSLRRLFERQIIERFNRQWLPELENTEADMVWVGKGAWAVPWLWQELKRCKPRTRLVCYNADNPIITYSRGGNRPWVTASIPCFDLYCTYNASLVEPLRQAGAQRVVNIPFAWDTTLHPDVEPPPEAQQRYGCDVLFIGNGDAHREHWLKDIMAAANGSNWRFAIYGHWRCKDAALAQAVRGGPVCGAEMVRTIRAAKVSLNILRRQNEGSHNMRTFEIPGCGGAMVSQKSSEQEQFFPEGEAACYFSTPQEAVAQIRRLIENPSLLERLRGAAHEIAHGHTYVQRAKTLLQAAESPA